MSLVLRPCISRSRILRSSVNEKSVLNYRLNTYATESLSDAEIRNIAKAFTEKYITPNVSLNLPSAQDVELDRLGR